MLKLTDYVWYASYGSNINRDRFLCYIEGGRPDGSEKIEVGCNDSSLPKAESPFLFNHPLYFTKRAKKWQNQGAAFIANQKVATETTYSKKYLITLEQFFDVVKQENNGLEVNLNINDVIEQGSLSFLDAWYGTIIFLGEDGGYPIFTFTSNWDMNKIEFVQPSEQYLKTIVKGLKTFLTEPEVTDYFINKPGIKGNLTKQEIKELYNS